MCTGERATCFVGWRRLVRFVLQSAAPTKVEVRRFYRPEDISPDLAHSSDFWDVFASDEQLEVDVTDIVSKTRVAVGRAEGQHLKQASKRDPLVAGSVQGAESGVTPACPAPGAVVAGTDVEKRAGEDTFVCRKTFKRADGSFTDPPVDLTLLQKVCSPCPGCSAAAAGRVGRLE